jgi:hypothetical protein
MPWSAAAADFTDSFMEPCEKQPRRTKLTGTHRSLCQQRLLQHAARVSFAAAHANDDASFDEPVSARFVPVLMIFLSVCLCIQHSLQTRAGRPVCVRTSVQQPKTASLFAGFEVVKDNEQITGQFRQYHEAV